ncbi:hypothetical protein FPV67DRAFT_1677612 [Lyophyllum atratum]|nr:hypothetical protein FPV67DRAFT_1677612 [Lyophyllum atratum]
MSSVDLNYAATELQEHIPGVEQIASTNEGSKVADGEITVGKLQNDNSRVNRVTKAMDEQRAVHMPPVDLMAATDGSDTAMNEDTAETDESMAAQMPLVELTEATDGENAAMDEETTGPDALVELTEATDGENAAMDEETTGPDERIVAGDRRVEKTSQKAADMEEDGNNGYKTNNESSQKGKKRARVEELSVQHFLSVEAEVDSDEDEKEDEDEEADEEFLQAGELSPMDWEASHHLLALEHIRAQDEREWGMLLNRARERARELTRDVAHAVNHEDPFPRPCLWRVAVMPGHEETVTLVLMEKVLRAGVGHWSVSSIVGSVSRPGWIVVEAASEADVQGLCADVGKLFPRSTCYIDPEEAPRYLKEHDYFVPRAGSWVRLTGRGWYRGDLAYVKAFDSTSRAVEVLVIPRISLQPNKHKKQGRPDQALFNPKIIADVWGDSSVVKRNHAYMFKENSYIDGYLTTSTKSYRQEEAVPERDELLLFSNARIIPPSLLSTSIEKRFARNIKHSDRVKVVEGESKGTVGSVLRVMGEVADILTEPDHQEVSLPVNALRNYLKVGDEVKITEGENEGLQGFILSVGEEKVTVYENKEAKEVEVLATSVMFAEAPHIMALLPIEEKQICWSHGDVNRRFLNTRVRVIKHPQFKDYVGTVVETADDNFVMVKLDARPEKQRLHLTILVLENDPHMIPLLHDGAYRSDFTRVYRSVEIPESTLTLTPSTPLPEGSSAAFGPAWDPSSRTPNPSSPFPHNPWMIDPAVIGKSIRVNITGTRPSLRDPGWRYGDHEGKTATWLGTESSNAKIKVARDTFLIPEKYIQPLRPTIKSQLVVSLDVWKRGEIQRVHKCEGNECVVGPNNSDRRKVGVNLFPVPTNTLAVVIL